MTGWIADHGVYAVFVLMAVDALLPVGGELIMLYAGALAGGAIAGAHVTLFGATLSSGTEAFVVLALAGSLGYLAGALLGWEIGRRGGRTLIERHGTWMHLSPRRFHRAETWFDRHGPQAVFLGRITPLVRSFISIPAGVLRSPLGGYTLLTLGGSLIWCFAFAGAGWAAGSQWDSVHHNLRFLDYLVVAAVLVAAAALLLRRRRMRAS